MSACEACGIRLCHEDCESHRDGPSVHARILELEGALIPLLEAADYIHNHSESWNGVFPTDHPNLYCCGVDDLMEKARAALRGKP